MGLNRYAARRDANEPDIIRGLEKCGFKVHQLREPVDLLIWPKAGGRFGLVEVKDPRQIPSKRRLKPSQVEFFAESEGCPRAKVETFTEALAFAEGLRT